MAPFDDQELFIIGSPVNAGRLPTHAVNHFKTMKGCGALSEEGLAIHFFSGIYFILVTVHAWSLCGITLLADLHCGRQQLGFIAGQLL
jgi:hypothetical protein